MHIKRLLIANRGEIAVRIIRTAKSLGLTTISIYTQADAASLHVSLADETILLEGDEGRAYTDGAQIIKIAQDHKVDAIIPGYGFLSENADFARSVSAAGIVWCGPDPEAIEKFGVKHIARKLAQRAGVPIAPGTEGLVPTATAAVEESEELGYPVMLKATGGGGGMALVICHNADDVRKGFDTVTSRGEQLFENSGLFIEKYYPASRHIPIQIFGNGQGNAVHFGERECSVQRRHQKVVEECPSPFVEKHPELREKLGSAAVALVKSVNYGSVGTIEYLVDDQSGDFFFLEMNTRLQVEHGITELCYGVDLVELMLRQADTQAAGRKGLSKDETNALTHQYPGPNGHAIEVRLYAENPIRDFAPSPGLLQSVEWHMPPGTRVDTFAFTGTRISNFYDPMIAKVMNRADTRDKATDSLLEALSRTKVLGPSTNLEYLKTILQDGRFKAGHTLTSFLKNMHFQPTAIDVISGGAYTLVEDLPGRPTIAMGICHSGAMDSVALSVANMLVGNKRGKAGLEITLSGPELRFLASAVVALTGAPIEADLDGRPVPMWSRLVVQPNQKLKIGRTTGNGCRAYLAIHGGLPSIADYFGSKSTSPVVAIGGMQGRPLAPGDLLSITPDWPKELEEPMQIPEHLQPQYPKLWEMASMPGPHDAEYFSAKDIDMLYATEWEVSHNASRSAIRLNGPTPEWSRPDGREGGAHPSNVVEYGYPLGGLNWTGDVPALLVPDGPNFGGFVCSHTAVSSDLWKLGQVKAGDKILWRTVTIDEAIQRRKQLEQCLDSFERGIAGDNFQDAHPIGLSVSAASHLEKSVIFEQSPQAGIPRIRYRQGGDQHLIVSYAEDTDVFDLNNKVRVATLEKAVKATEWLRESLYTTVGTTNNLTIYYDSLKLDRQSLLDFLLHTEMQLGDLSTSRVPCRRLKLPLSFTSKEQDEANKRYQETARPYAPYLPNNFNFVARNNAFTNDHLKQCFLQGDFLTVFVGFYCGLPDAIPVNPLHRFFSPKANPSRVFTPEGTVGLGGGAIAIYPVDSPGGYQMTGRTLPCWDYHGWKQGFTPDRPWLFSDFDLIRFYEVSEEKLNGLLLDFRAGKYQFEWEETVFDLAKHNDLLEKTAEGVKTLREKQKNAQDVMVEEDKISLDKCKTERERYQVDESTLESLLSDLKICVVEAPVDANVWKVTKQEGEEIAPNECITILEAMKLEINVYAPNEQVTSGKVERLLVKPGDSVKAGSKLALLRMV